MTKANEMIYCVKDSNGRFGGKLGIYSNNMETGRGDYKWDYYSTEIPQTVVVNGRESVELKIKKLRELNSLAKFDLIFEIVEFTHEQWEVMIDNCHKKYVALGVDPMMVSHYTSSIVMKDVQEKCVTKHRKMVNEIYKRYKNGSSVKKLVS